MKERWWLDYVPFRMRSWPVLRKYFWQRDEIDAARKKAAEWKRLFGG